MADLKYVTYCGLYCKQCTTLARIPQQAQVLYNTMKREGFDFFGPYASEKFIDFWDYLQELAKQDKTDCRGGCGDPGCRIRICARKKNQEICVYCKEYPCELIDNLARRYPALLGDGQRLIEIGIDAWLSAQEERCDRGYCFMDGRYDIGPEQEQGGHIR